jgi:hypothetical protein
VKTRLLVQIGIALIAVSSLRAQSQRDMVCQGSCGGGCGPCPTTASPSSTSPATLNPALSNAAQSVGNALGQELGKALFGDPAAKAAAAAAAQQRNLGAQQSALAAQQLNNSGIYLLKNGKTPAAINEAINEFQQALNITPNDANILHNLALAKQRLKDTAVAAKTSAALGPLLDSTPAGINPHPPVTSPNASALNLVNLDPNVVDFRGLPGRTTPPAPLPNSDPNVVNLSGATTTSPASLKSQIDAVFGNSAPASALVTPADVSAVFDKPVPDPNATMKAIFDLNYKPK